MDLHACPNLIFHVLANHSAVGLIARKVFEEGRMEGLTDCWPCVVDKTGCESEFDHDSAGRWRTLEGRRKWKSSSCSVCCTRSRFPMEMYSLDLKKSSQGQAALCAQRLSAPMIDGNAGL